MPSQAPYRHARLETSVVLHSASLHTTASRRPPGTIRHIEVHAERGQVDVVNAEVRDGHEEGHEGVWRRGAEQDQRQSLSFIERKRVRRDLAAVNQAD